MGTSVTSASSSVSSLINVEWLEEMLCPQQMLWALGGWLYVEQKGYKKIHLIMCYEQELTTRLPWLTSFSSF